MSVLINAYCTHRNPPAINFPHQLNSRRDRSDPELMEHLNGFIGYIMQGGERQMTQSLYYAMRHIERVQNHYSLEFEEDQLDAYGAWAMQANAISYLVDNSVCDAAGRVLVDPETGEADDEAQIPYPQDAIKRKHRMEQRMDKEEINVLKVLPPVISEVEVDLRPAKEVALRALSLFAVALRGESLNAGEPIPVDQMKSRLPLAFQAMSPKEQAFFASASPERQEIVDAAWRYDAVFMLQWALGWIDKVSWPTAICDVSQIARMLLDADRQQLVNEAQLRPTSEILDMLDMHFRLHWTTRQATNSDQPCPGGLDNGVIQERHHTLNWLIRFEDADWDDVGTPT